MRKFLTYPPFKVQATVSVWLPADHYSMHPDARLRIECYIRTRDDLHAGAKYAAESALRRFGVTDEVLKGAMFEQSVDAYIALEPRGVRNPDREPVEAFYFFDEKDEKRRALLIRQRRLVPECETEMVRMYGPKPEAQTTAAKAAAQ